MNSTIIRLLYRKIIDARSQQPWERFVFDDSYAEFLLQAQLYDREKKHATFGGLIAAVPDAEKLHFLVSPSITGHIKQLQGIVPDILNTTGKHFLPFRNYKFEIINSDIRNKAQHQVAINFLSAPVTWYDTIGNQLLVALNGQPAEDGSMLTDNYGSKDHPLQYTPLLC